MVECVVCGATLDIQQLRKGKTVICPECAIELEVVDDHLVMIKIGHSNSKTLG